MAFFTFEILGSLSHVARGLIGYVPASGSGSCATAGALIVVFCELGSVAHSSGRDVYGRATSLCKVPHRFVSMRQTILGTHIHCAAAMDVAVELNGLGPHYVILHTPWHAASHFIGQEWIFWIASEIKEQVSIGFQQPATLCHDSRDPIQVVLTLITIAVVGYVLVVGR